MECTQITHLEFAERCLLGKLTPDERDAYERHYFECPNCFQELQHLLVIQEELKAHPLKATLSQKPGRIFGSWWAWPAFAGVAAALLAGVILFPSFEDIGPAPPSGQAEWGGSDSARTGILAALARVDPPAYEAPVLRGMYDTASVAFQEGMKDYLAGNYASAADQLHEAAAADPSRPDISFYLGATELLSGRPDVALAEFERVIAMDGNAFTEEAHFYLGKALLRQDRLDDAKNQFAFVVSIGGPLQNEAKAVLEALAELGSKPAVE